MYIKKQRIQYWYYWFNDTIYSTLGTTEYIQHLTFNSAVQTLEDILPQVREQADIVVVKLSWGL